MKRNSKKGITNTTTAVTLTDLAQPTILVTTEGAILNFNRSAANLFGINAEEVQNKDFFDLFKELHISPPSLDSIDSEELSYYSVHDNPIVYQWTASRIQATTMEEVICIVGTDLTKIINSRAQEQNIKNSIIDLLPNHYVFWKDKNSVYLGCNKLLASALGFESSQDIIGKTDYDLPTTKIESDAYRIDDQLVMEQKQVKLNIEEYQTLADGNKRIINTSKVPLMDNRGKVYGILAIYSDITERKNLELSLEKAKNQAEFENKAKTQFIANMSHDVRTPLAGIIGMSNLLKDFIENPEYKQYAQWINQCGEQLLSLLNSILDNFSNEKADDIGLKQEIFDLHACLESIIQLEKPSVIMKSLELILKLDKDLPKFIISDRDKLYRILLNLIGNAIKFTESGSIILEAKTLQLDEKTAKIHFKIQDSGIGIPIEEQKNIFEQFYRVDPSYKGNYQGHGVGLHIVQTYIQNLGGKIQLQSEPGEGTTFYFTLTFSLPDKEKCGFHEPQVKELEIKKLNKKPFLLLVEDNVIALRALELLAKKVGCDSVSASSGEEAIELYKKHRCDLIITDIGLPGICGNTLTKLIRELELAMNEPTVPIIGLTAHAETTAKTESFGAGMNGLYTKPISETIMHTILQDHLPLFLNTESPSP
jgi:PAS domain S-box-containing protein